MPCPTASPWQSCLWRHVPCCLGPPAWFTRCTLIPVPWLPWGLPLRVVPQLQGCHGPESGPRGHPRWRVLILYSP